MDFVTRETRSLYMAAVKSKGNISTEVKMIRLLRQYRLKGWRRHQRNIAGTPDFVWRDKKVALFVDGCFWHGCPHCYKLPKSNKAFWTKKVAYNRKHDRQIISSLKSLGWKVVRIWECKISRKSTINKICSVVK